MNQPKLEIKTLPVASLVPYANNAKKHPEKQVKEIANSIEAFGNCDPIAVWTNERGEPEIVEGHGRVLALEKLGVRDAPVIFLDHLDDEQRRAYCLVHNQTTLSSGLEYQIVVEEIDNLSYDFNDFGFEAYTFDAGFEDAPDDDGAGGSDGITVTIRFPSEDDYMLCRGELVSLVESNDGSISVK